PTPATSPATKAVVPIPVHRVPSIMVFPPMVFFNSLSIQAWHPRSISSVANSRGLWQQLQRPVSIPFRPSRLMQKQGSTEGCRNKRREDPSDHEGPANLQRQAPSAHRDISMSRGASSHSFVTFFFMNTNIASALQQRATRHT